MADQDGGGDGVLTQADVDKAVKEALVAAKKDGDTAYNALWQEAKTAKEAAKSFDGIDVDEYKKLKAASAKAEREKAEAEGDFQSLEEQLVARHKTELEAKDVVTEKYRVAMNKRLVEAELTRAITSAKGDATLLLPHAERFVRVRETEDDFEAFVVDEKGQPMFADGQATPATFETLVTEKLMAQFPMAFEGTGSSGGGATRSAGGAGGHARTIQFGDKAAMMANIEDVASGKTVVTE